MAFVGILLYAGNDANGLGKYVRLILSEHGHIVDRFEGRAEQDSFRSANFLYPGVTFQTMLRVTPSELNSHKPTAKARDDEWNKRRKQGEPFDYNIYHTEYHTHA